MKFSSIQKTSLLAGAAATTLALAMSSTVFAQDSDEPIDEIVATGIKRSIEQSIAFKRDNSSIVEAISAEDIGKLPDASIAESLSRLPGLAAQRVRGRASVISVRGLGPDFTSALLNGREQVTAGDNRGVEFDQFPAELLSSVLVYKTPDAALIGQGLAGTADLRTVRPLDYAGDTTVSVNARYELNDLGKLNAGSNDDGYRITGTYIDQNEDGTLGWMVGVATQSSPTQAERWNAWGYPTTGDGEFIIGGAKPYVESRDLKRDSIVGTLQFEPTDSLSVTADAFYSNFEDSGILRGIELPLFWSGAQLQPGYTVTDNIVTSGQFNGVDGVIRNDVRSRDADLLSLGLNVEYDINDLWSAEFDVSHSSLDRKDRDLETYSGTGRGGAGANANLTFTYDDNGNFVFGSDIDYADPSTILLTDPQGWGQVGFIKEPTTEDELTAIRGSLSRDFDDSGMISKVEVGMNYTTRDKSKRSEESFIDLASGADAQAIPSEFLLSPTELEFLGIPGMVSYDPNALLASGIYNLRPNTNADVVTKAWDVSEDVLTTYVKADIDTMLGDAPVTGNLGAQFVYTDQSSTGPGIQNGQIANITGGAEYLDVLPSANVSVEVAENTFVRLAAARTLARPRMEQLKASQGVGIDNAICGIENGQPFFRPELYSLADRRVCISGGGGNPELRPIKANAFDVSVEKYFADQKGYVSAAAFYKELSDFIYDGITNTSVSGQQAFDYTPIANDVFGAAFVGANPQVGQGLLTGPQNAKGGNLKGIELATNIPGEVVFGDGPLSGFGLFASYSYTDSSVTRPGDTLATDIPGLSKHVANITAYYEMDGFQARISNRYRSAFLGEVVGFGAGTETRNIRAENVVDAQIGYEFDSGSLNGLSIQLQAQNLTDEDYTTVFNGDDRAIQDYQRYGTTYLLGLGYKF